MAASIGDFAETADSGIKGMRSPRILVVEDDASLSEIACSFLELHGYRCIPAYSGTEALFAMRLSPREEDNNFPFDLVLCDLMLPGMPGEEVIRTIRMASIVVPIIVLSAKGHLDDRVSVLRMGADDYLVKPFEFEELLARIEVQLRRLTAHTPNEPPATAHEQSENILVFGRWTVNIDNRTLTVGETSVRLTRTEFDIVHLLVEHPGRAFARSELLQAVNGDGEFRDDKTARAHIGNIRAKLRATGTEDYIETVWGFGFKLTEHPW